MLLVPGDVAWLDVVIPAADALWQDDVGRAFGWLGDAWVRALDALGFRGGVVHEGALWCTAWSSYVCFAGLGAGEVTVDGFKVVGISQRRTRAGARFQCAALRRWDPEALARLLRLDEPARARLVADVAPSAAPVDVAADDLLGALLHELAAR